MFGVRLEPWTSGDRLKALATSVVAGPDGTHGFNAGDYLREMLSASVVETDPEQLNIWELDSNASAILVDAVVGLNVPKNPLAMGSAQGLETGTRQVALSTLRLCRYLGWTPSRVWATPASEVDVLLSMLDVVEGTATGLPPEPEQESRYRGLAAHPDAIVIQVEDDPA